MTPQQQELCRKHGIFAGSARGLLALYILRVGRMRLDLESRPPRASVGTAVPAVPRSFAVLGI